ncbi:hypothetical protein L6Q96_15375 [Candidatus Binatia bacterium]|nr:hypothetical protein [Candidatus Binatia bacterium]
MPLDAPEEQRSPRRVGSPPREEDDPRYRRARAAYLRLLSEGRLRCGETCPLWTVGHCTTRCW